MHHLIYILFLWNSTKHTISLKFFLMTPHPIKRHHASSSFFLFWSSTIMDWIEGKNFTKAQISTFVSNKQSPFVAFWICHTSNFHFPATRNKVEAPPPCSLASWASLLVLLLCFWSLFDSVLVLLLKVMNLINDEVLKVFILNGFKSFIPQHSTAVIWKVLFWKFFNLQEL